MRFKFFPTEKFLDGTEEACKIIFEGLDGFVQWQNQGITLDAFTEQYLTFVREQFSERRCTTQTNLKKAVSGKSFCMGLPLIGPHKPIVLFLLLMSYPFTTRSSEQGH